MLSGSVVLRAPHHVSATRPYDELKLGSGTVSGTEYLEVGASIPEDTEPSPTRSMLMVFCCQHVALPCCSGTASSGYRDKARMLKGRMRMSPEVQGNQNKMFADLKGNNGTSSISIHWYSALGQPVHV